MAKQKTPSLRAAIAVAVFTAAALCTTATTARADTIVFNNGPGPGSQSNFVLGMDFDVLGLIEVTQLGAFDSLGNGFAGAGVTVGIFSTTGVEIVSAQLTGSPGPLVGGSRFVTLATPFVLGPGSYSIVASGFVGGNFSGNTGIPPAFTSFNNVGGRLALIPQGGRWTKGNTFALPASHPYAQSDPVFQAGTFQANAVPDGGSAAALLGLGLLGVGWARRRFR